MNTAKATPNPPEIELAGFKCINQLIFNNKTQLTVWTWANQTLSLFDRQGQVQHGP